MANEELHVSKNGLQFIKNWEGVVLHPYQDVVKIWTIGVGHVMSAQEKIDYASGITLEKALDILAIDVQRFERAIVKYIKVDLNQNQFDSILDLIFNTGEGPIATGGLGKVLNAENFDAAPAEFVKWCKAGGAQNTGLLNRRKAEVALFLTPIKDTELTDEEKQQILNSVNLSITSNLDDLYSVDEKEDNNA